eukprot:scaffold48651_cov24-Tisochrysis_lutea.AAC.1
MHLPHFSHCTWHPLRLQTDRQAQSGVACDKGKYTVGAPLGVTPLSLEVPIYGLWGSPKSCWLYNRPVKRRPWSTPNAPCLPLPALFLVEESRVLQHPFHAAGTAAAVGT